MNFKNTETYANNITVNELIELHYFLKLIIDKKIRKVNQLANLNIDQEIAYRKLKSAELILNTKFIDSDNVILNNIKNKAKYLETIASTYSKINVEAPKNIGEIDCLVIGSAHLDVFGDTNTSSTAIDKIGSVKFGIGGTAYNIACNLSYLGANTFFITASNPNSFFKDILTSNLRKTHIQNIIVTANELKDGGFIAHRIDGELISAITATPIESIAINQNNIPTLDAVLQNIRSIFLELNNSIETIVNLGIYAESKKIPTFICSVSDTKVLKLLELKKECPAFTPSLIFLNRYEANALLKLYNTQLPNYDVFSQIYDTIWIITLDKDGIVIINKDKQIVKFDAPKLNHITSLSGAGDALAAGFSYYHIIKKLSINESVMKSYEIVTKVIESEHANIFEDNLLKIIGDSHEIKESIKQKKESIFENKLLMFAGTVIGIIGFFISFGDIKTIFHNMIIYALAFLK